MSEWEIEPPAEGGTVSRQGRTSGPTRGEPATPSEPPSGIAVGGLSQPPPAPQPETGRPRPGPSRPGRVRFSSLWLGIAIVMLLIGLVGGYFIARSQAADDDMAVVESKSRVGELQAALAQAQDRNWSYFRANEALKQQLEQVTSSSTTATAPGVADHGGVFDDGVYLVGEDIPAGTYDGVVNGEFGYWARLKGTDGTIASIVENGIVRGPFVLTLNPSDKAVELRGVTLTER
jgi:hypothetical protein